MKLLLIAFSLVLLTAFSVSADVPKPKTPDKAPKQVLRTGLEIVPDAKVYEAKLQIGQSDFNILCAATNGSSPVVGGIAFSAPRTIVAGLLMFMALSVAGVLIARSSSVGRAQKTVAAALLLAVLLGAAAIITRGNAGPPPAWRWRNLPQNLSEGKPTLGGVEVEVVPDDQVNGRSLRLIIPLKKQSSTGEE
jgi:hypothetical protein